MCDSTYSTQTSTRQCDKEDGHVQQGDLIHQSNAVKWLGLGVFIWTDEYADPPCPCDACVLTRLSFGADQLKVDNPSR